MQGKKAKARVAKKVENVVVAGQESTEKTVKTGAVVAVKAAVESAEKAARAEQDAAEKAARESAEKATRAEQVAAEKLVRENAEKAAKAEQEAIEKLARESAEKAAKADADAKNVGYDQYLALTKEQLEKVLPGTVGRFEDFASFNKGTVDVLIQAGNVAAKAFETIGDDVVSYNRQVWEDSIATTKALFGCKTFEEVIELQANAARTQFEKFAADSAKLGELSLKTANETFEPINARVNEAIDKFGKPISA